VRTVTQPQPPAYAHQPSIVVQRPRGNGFGVASFVLGLFSLLAGGIPLFIGLFLSFLPTLLAITFGIVGLATGSRGRRPIGLAVAGLVLGGLTFCLWFVGYGIIW
jgi:hypothetical protein